MEVDADLKKMVRPVDLALKASRKRQSSKTRFVHGTVEEVGALELISIYDNFCFAMALLEQRRGDDVGEAKELLTRLLEFQTREGNFPVYLHDFPNCSDALQRLKVAPFLARALQDFGAVLGNETREKILEALTRALHFEKELPPLWQFRKDVLSGDATKKPGLSFHTPSEWWEYWISLQFIETPTTCFFHAGLKICGGLPLKIGQEGLNPAPQLLEWMLYPQKPEHPLMIHLAALKELHAEPFAIADWRSVSTDDTLLLAAPSENEPISAKFLWKGDARIHSWVIPTSGKVEIQDNRVEIIQRLDDPCPISRGDLFETQLFVDADPELQIFINGQKGTVFRLGDQLTIHSSRLQIEISCEILEGAGAFCGHIFRGNRPGQLSHQNYEAYDWRIGVRTIRRSNACALRWIITRHCY